MKIVVDAMGGDFAPKVNVDGAIDALREYSDMEIILVGPQALVEDTITAYAQPEEMAKVRHRRRWCDAPGGSSRRRSHPVMALRRKKNSTFVIGMDIVRRKEAEAFVSAGSTGALMAGAMFKIGRIKGIDRPALATLLPVPGRPLLLVDAGANTDCKPSWIVQFGMMGSAYMNRVMNVEKPEVGLLNIGVEAAEGNEQAPGDLCADGEASAVRLRGQRGSARCAGGSGGRIGGGRFCRQRAAQEYRRRHLADFRFAQRRADGFDQGQARRTAGKGHVQKYQEEL